MRSKPHIAYVCADRGVPVGGCKGASAHVAELTAALRRQGADVRLVAARTADNPAPQVLVLGADRAMRAARQILFEGARTKRQQARAAEAHSLLLNQALARELDRLHRRWRVDAIYERYSLWSYAAAAVARSLRVPYFLEVNAPLREEQRRYRTLENAPLAASFEAYLFRSADHVLVPSAQLRPYVVAHGARAAAAGVMPNGADPGLYERVQLLRRARSRSEAFVVGFLGTLKPWHGLRQLLSAFRQLRRRSAVYRLLIAGDGPLRGEHERATRQWGLRDHVTFTGEVEHEGIAAVLATMDVAVAPYPRLAGFYFSPLKVFEYLAAGLPVVASEIGQIGEVLCHGRTALLHAPGAVREMVENIERLRQDPALARRLGAAGHRLVARRFSWDRNAERVLALVESARRRDRGSRRRSR